MRRQRIGGALVCALAFVMLFGYALARPSTESMFLELYGSARLPAVWAAVALAAVVVVAIYNRAAARHPLGHVMAGSVVVSAATLFLLLALRRVGFGGASFLLYVWKDVHIVVLLEGLWMFANLVFELKTARWAYGVFCAAGSLGGISGNLVIGKLALAWGTGTALWLLPVVFALEIVLIAALARSAGHPAPSPSATDSSMAGDWHILRTSPYLGWLLALIGLVQIVITLIDYAYNVAIVAAYPTLDARTEVIGQIYAAIDACSLLLQLATGMVLRLAGLRLTLLAIPALLGAVVASFAVVPRFALMALTKIASKVFDYSLFRAAKEMLYIPLSYAEKTRGKAIVDMLTYRVAKGGVSIILAVMVAFDPRASILAAIAICVVAWLMVTLVVTRRYAAVGASSEDAG